MAWFLLFLALVIGFPVLVAWFIASDEADRRRQRETLEAEHTARMRGLLGATVPTMIELADDERREWRS